MVAFLIILTIIACALLVIVVLAQNSKGGGLSNFASGSSQLMGVKRTGDLLEKLTWGFAIAIMLFSISINLIAEKPTGDETSTSINVEKAKAEAKKKATEQNMPGSVAPIDTNALVAPDSGQNP